MGDGHVAVQGRDAGLGGSGSWVGRDGSLLDVASVTWHRDPTRVPAHGSQRGMAASSLTAVTTSGALTTQPHDYDEAPGGKLSGTADTATLR